MINIAQYIERFNNKCLRHSSLCNLLQEEYEKK